MENQKNLMLDNPANRLLNVLEKAIKLKTSDHELSNIAWAKVLGALPTAGDLFTNYGKLFQLADEAYLRVIQYYPKQVSSHEKWKNHYNHVFKNYSPYHHTWGDVKKLLVSESHLSMLQIASDLLDRHVKKTAINNLSIVDLKNDFSELLDAIKSSEDISEYLKMYLINELEKLVSCIENFDLNGASEIENSIYRMVSNSEVTRKQDTAVVKKIIGFVIVVSTAISIINDVASLPQSIDNIKSYFSSEGSEREEDKNKFLTSTARNKEELILTKD